MFDGGKLTLGGVARLKVDAARAQIGLPATPDPPPPVPEAVPEAAWHAERRKTNELLLTLVLTQPAFAECLPLAIGIHLDIQAALGCDPRLLSSALRHWCSSPRYLRAIAKGGPRYQLNRTVMGEVTPEQMASAERSLLKMKQSK